MCRQTTGDEALVAFSYKASPHCLVACSSEMAAMLAELLRHVRAVGAAWVTLTTPSVNVGGIAFYCSVGFETSRTFTVPQGADALELSELSLRVADE